MLRKGPTGQVEVEWSRITDRDLDGVFDWMEVVDSFKRRGWKWGGDWKSFPDFPHFEKTFGYSTDQLRRMPKQLGTDYPIF